MTCQGWGNGSISKVLALQDPSSPSPLMPQSLVRRLGVATHTCDPSLGEAETPGELWGLAGS